MRKSENIHFRATSVLKNKLDYIVKHYKKNNLEHGDISKLVTYLIENEYERIKERKSS